MSCVGVSRPVDAFLACSYHSDANVSHPLRRLAHAKHRHRPAAAQDQIGPAGLEGTFRWGSWSDPPFHPASARVWPHTPRTKVVEAGVGPVGEGPARGRRFSRSFDESGY